MALEQKKIMEIDEITLMVFTIFLKSTPVLNHTLHSETLTNFDFCYKKIANCFNLMSKTTPRKIHNAIRLTLSDPGGGGPFCPTLEYIVCQSFLVGRFKLNP